MSFLIGTRFQLLLPSKWWFGLVGGGVPGVGFKSNHQSKSPRKTPLRSGVKGHLRKTQNIWLKQKKKHSSATPLTYVEWDNCFRQWNWGEGGVIKHIYIYIYLFEADCMLSCRLNFRLPLKWSARKLKSPSELQTVYGGYVSNWACPLAVK